ncbi:MAG: hypothetical protein D3925_02600 [Candidatus Electrothrix sp. AR5]|nr:hypothetical protein [Candidatus Electrothrix sp. AR5]
MRKIISYSLYSSKRRPVSYYVRGAYRAIALNSVFFPGWEIHFYVSSDVYEDHSIKLSSLGAQVFDQGESSGHSGTFWRFIPFTDPTIDVALFRDCDCRPTNRERRIVELWLSSSKAVHIIRDMPKHRNAVMAGLWGVRFPPEWMRSAFQDRFMEIASVKSSWGDDELWLATSVYPLIQSEALEHDSNIDATPFMPEPDGYLVGQSEDA